MKIFFSYFIAFLIVFIALSTKVHGFENESNLDKSQMLILKKYADRFCSAKADHYFEGLDNEKTLKYSYFKYIGLQSKEMYSKDMYQTLINQIRNKCHISKKEEGEINELFTKKS
tara:strand:+ start:371 stop:715 length:345 start_codon:yes stop_codon:yes gene_type:complete